MRDRVAVAVPVAIRDRVPDIVAMLLAKGVPVIDTGPCSRRSLGELVSALVFNGKTVKVVVLVIVPD
jgi:hypothetical protein